MFKLLNIVLLMILGCFSSLSSSSNQYNNYQNYNINETQNINYCAQEKETNNIKFDFGDTAISANKRFG